MKARVWLGGQLPLILGLLLALLFSQTSLANPVLYLHISLNPDDELIVMNNYNSSWAVRSQP